MRIRRSKVFVSFKKVAGGMMRSATAKKRTNNKKPSSGCKTCS